LVDVRGQLGRTEFLVKWKGYGSGENTWEEERALNCPDILREFWRGRSVSQRECEERRPGSASPCRGDFGDGPAGPAQENSSVVCDIRSAEMKTTKKTLPATARCVRLQTNSAFISSDDSRPHGAAKQERVASTPSRSSDETTSDVDDAGSPSSYEVERFIDTRKIGSDREFLVRWKGFGENDDSWEPERNMNCRDMIDEFLEDRKRAASDRRRQNLSCGSLQERAKKHQRVSNVGQTHKR